MKETREYVPAALAVVPRVRTVIIAVKSVRRHAQKPTVVVDIRNAEPKREGLV